MDLKVSSEATSDLWKSRNGVFALISTQKSEPEDMLTLYYLREQIEQVFGAGKNCACLLPLNAEKEETFQGHLMLSFITTIIMKALQDLFIDKKVLFLRGASGFEEPEVQGI